MPAWLIPILIGLAEKLGFAALDVLSTKFPSWKVYIDMLKDALSGIPHTFTKDEKKAARKAAKKKAVKAILEVHNGVGSAPDTKGL